TLIGDILHALVEAYALTEALLKGLTYNQMLTATQAFWASRFENTKRVYTKPPGLVVLKDGTVDLTFDFQTEWAYSTEKKPHKGYVKFIPVKGQPERMNKFIGLFKKLGTRIKKMFGKKIPPQILNGADLRNMLVDVSCDCKDFKYRMSYANVQSGVTSQAGRT